MAGLTVVTCGFGAEKFLAYSDMRGQDLEIYVSRLLSRPRGKKKHNGPFNKTDKECYGRFLTE